MAKRIPLISGRLVQRVLILLQVSGVMTFTCPATGSVYETSTESTCFWYLDGYPSTSAAHAMCVAAGGRLAYIPDSDTNIFVAAYLTSIDFPGMPSINVKNYYVSGSYVYETIEGDPLTYTNWEGGNPIPGEECVAFKPINGRWFDISCGQTYGGICSHTSPRDPTERQSQYLVSAGSRLDVTPLSTIVVRSHSECVVVCESTDTCIAFNYRSDTKACELLSDNHATSNSLQGIGIYYYGYNADVI
ncbi:pulmonary surfactant-associated protein A-like [Pecten maximus]|uniref:pulmonary surfactant-associated protein A-like n=1 Tax=Pecten maximus TaxID=6579 RepID=UPI00145828BB|nr:pulmonary surfactant-associated protein A-like [Pecten maximus]